MALLRDVKHSKLFIKSRCEADILAIAYQAGVTSVYRSSMCVMENAGWEKLFSRYVR